MEATVKLNDEATSPLNLQLHDLGTPPTDDLALVQEGLSRAQKELSPKFFYDQTGSRLFDRITETPEYYVTRTEAEIFQSSLHPIREALKPAEVLVEPGSGNCRKAIPLIRDGGMRYYVPIEISGGFLAEACQQLAAEIPEVAIHAVCGDFTRCQTLPAALPDGDRVLFFPGSTIGNFEPEAAAALLQGFGQLVGDGGYLLIGTDLIKDTAVLDAAYNDAQGITAAFNLNMLHHLNHRLDCDTTPADFRHRAFFNTQKSRIEMHLEAQKATRIRAGAQQFDLRAGETIHTESSYKYSPEGFTELAKRAGFSLEERWMDSRGWFAVHLFRCHAGDPEAA
ncbi:L-histidine N(alpha)-methyltransferase [Marinobacteraceae bacterium S3BR75-40.1]